MDFFVLDNTNNYRVAKLRDETGALVSDAILTVEIREIDLETKNTSQLPVAGLTWPLAFSSEGKGDYRVELPEDLPLIENTQYLTVIEGNANGRIFKETRDLYAIRRLTV